MSAELFFFIGLGIVISGFSYKLDFKTLFFLLACEAVLLTAIIGISVLVNDFSIMKLMLLEYPDRISTNIGIVYAVSIATIINIIKQFIVGVRK